MFLVNKLLFNNLIIIIIITKWLVFMMSSVCTMFYIFLYGWNQKQQLG